MGALITRFISGFVSDNPTFGRVASEELLRNPIFKSSKIANELAKKILSESSQPRNQGNVKFSFSNDKGEISATFSHSGKLLGYKYNEQRDGHVFECEQKTVEMLSSPGAANHSSVVPQARMFWLRNSAYNVGKVSLPLFTIAASLYACPDSMGTALFNGLGTSIAYSVLVPMIFS